MSTGARTASGGAEVTNDAPRGGRTDHGSPLETAVLAVQAVCRATCRREVLGAIQDVVVTILGSESYAIYELDARGETLELAAAMGDVAQRHVVPLRQGILGRVARSGVPFCASDASTLGAGDEDAALACVPLDFRGTPVGVLAIYDVLPHRGGLRDVDLDLLAVLGTVGGHALHLLGRAAPEPVPSPQ